MIVTRVRWHGRKRVEVLLDVESCRRAGALRPHAAHIYQHASKEYVSAKIVYCDGYRPSSAKKKGTS